WRFNDAVAIGVLVAMAALLLVQPAAAHPVPFSYLDLRMQPASIDRPASIEGSLVVHVFDAAHDLGVTPAERLLDANYMRDGAAARALEAMLAPRFTVAADGRALTPTWLDVEAIPDRQSLRLRMTFPLNAPSTTPLTTESGTVTVTAHMFPYDPQH